MPKTCLIAAHDPWFIQLLKIYSEEFGFRVVQAFDAQEVISKATHEQPSVILLQLDLPGAVKGQDMLKMMRIDAKLKHIPVFVFTWQGSQEELIEGATMHLMEPITYEGFVTALQSAGLGEPSTTRLPTLLNSGSSLRRRIHK
jgi:DNA-binding response OmpR family regulator